MKSLLSLFIFILGSYSLISQQTRLVPAEFTTIQSALSASQSGDIVMVSPGTYYEHITWPAYQNGVELRSTDGPETTIIDANFNGRALHFHVDPWGGTIDIDKTTIIDGFTLRNGFLNAERSDGAGIFVENASPTLRNLIIENNQINSERARGGGISFHESFSTIENCTIRNNSIISDGWANGGGVYVTDSNVDFHDCNIMDNSNVSGSWSYGGGIYIDESDAQLINCTISGNTTDGGGWSYGAGIKIYGILGALFYVDIIGCTITNNRPLGSRKYGSGIYGTYEVDLNIVNSLIYENGPSTSTLYLEIETANIINSTIANNQSGIRCRELDLNITNSIIWNNEYTIQDQAWQEDSDISVDHSLIEGGWFGPGNIDSDPLFYNEDLLIPTENSPCLNAGNKNIPTTTDINGNERPFPKGSAPDIGAYEINQNFAHVLSRFFFDENKNGIQEENEVLIGRGAIQINEADIEENSSPNGIFTLVNQGSTKINYYYTNTGFWALSSPIDEYIFDVNEDNFADTIYFGIYPSRVIKDLATGIYSPSLRCSRTITMEFFVKNEGTTREDGTLWVQIDPLSSEIVPHIAPDFVDGNTLGWNFYNLLPGESFTRKVDFKVPGVEDIEQGDLLKYVSEATVTSDPECLATFCYEDEVRCAYDPNDKLVNPDRLDKLLLRDQDVTFTIRFQNVGNDYADDVVVVDTLDSNFDLESFKLLKTSHPENLRYTLSSSGILNFDFHQIYLPDSTTDEQGSNGYIMYSIRPDSTLTNYIKVENTAHIYFDFNPAIVTNTTENSVVDAYPVLNSTEVEKPTLEISPNPSFRVFYLQQEYDQIEILDNSGKHIKTILKDNKFSLEANPSGVYLVRAIKDNEMYLGKAVLVDN